RAVANLDEILDVADGAMVARGDLALQVGRHHVPAIQKQVIAACRVRGKPVIVATQMLERMERSPIPTRADVRDVWNAVWDGTDAVMLSNETSIGDFPLHAISEMHDIAAVAELHWYSEARAEFRFQDMLAHMTGKPTSGFGMVGGHGIRQV